MAYLLVLLAALLVIPAVGIGLAAVCLALAAGAIVLLCAVALGASGTLIGRILAATALGVSWPAAQPWHRLAQRLKAVLATAGPGFGRLRGG